MLETNRRPASHRRQWVVGHPDGNPQLFAEEQIQPAEQGAATRQHQAVIHEIRHQFGMTVLNDALDAVQDRRDRFPQRFANLFTGDQRLPRNPTDRIETPDFAGQLLLQGIGASQFELQLFRLLMANPQRKLLLQVFDDCII